MIDIGYRYRYRYHWYHTFVSSISLPKTFQNYPIPSFSSPKNQFRIIRINRIIDNIAKRNLGVLMDSFRIYQAWERIPCWNVDENTFHLPLLPVAVHNWHFIEIQKFRSIRNFWQMQHRSFLELAAAASCENFSQDLHQVQYQCRSKAETRWWHGIKVVEFDSKISSQWFQLANLHFQCGPSSKRILLPSLVWPHSGSWWFWQDLSQFALHHIEVRINALPPVSWIFPPWCLRVWFFFKEILYQAKVK